MRQRKFNGNAYRQSAYGQQSAARSYDNGYQNRSGRPPKHSGCNSREVEGGIIVWGWKLSDGAMIKMYARPYKGTQVKTSKTGKIGEERVYFS